MAESLAIAVSPGAQEISLLPGEIYEGEFLVLNPFPENGEMNFKISVAPFTVEDEDFSLDFDDKTDLSQITDWISLETSTGTLSEYNSVAIRYRIAVPTDAPAGGQYAAFLVRGIPADESAQHDSSASIRSASQVAMLLYATVAGETRVEGKVVENNISPVYLNTPVKTSVLLSNTGNVHSRASTTLRIYPLFSNEEVYTTEETPETTLVLPNSRAFSEKTWEETPLLGLFRVEQEVDFAGIYTVKSKTVLIAPTWFVILAALFIVAVFYAFIERLALRKNRQKKSKKSQKSLDFGNHKRIIKSTKRS